MRHLVLAVPLILSACAGQTTGPSLAKRAIESTSLSEPQVEAIAPAAADADLRARIEALLVQAREGQSAFAAILPRARSTAESAGAEASESWIVAQQQLSALEAARAPTTRALGELDALLVARLDAHADAGVVEIQAAQVEAGALADAQQRDIDALRARISG